MWHEIYSLIKLLKIQLLLDLESTDVFPPTADCLLSFSGFLHKSSELSNKHLKTY